MKFKIFSSFGWGVFFACCAISCAPVLVPNANAAEVCIPVGVDTDIRKAGGQGSAVGPSSGQPLQVGSYLNVNEKTGARFAYLARALLDFENVKIVPARAKIRSVKLRVCNVLDRLSRKGVVELEVYALEQPFSVEYVTWNQADISVGLNWKVGPGAIAIDGQPLAKVAVSLTSTAPEVIEWSGGILTEYVRKQCAAGLPVRFVVKAANESLTTQESPYRELFNLVSAEHLNETIRPQLIVNYE